MFTGLGATGMRRQAPGMRPPLRTTVRYVRSIDLLLSTSLVFGHFFFAPAWIVVDVTMMIVIADQC